MAGWSEVWCPKRVWWAEKSLFSLDFNSIDGVGGGIFTETPVGPLSTIPSRAPCPLYLVSLSLRPEPLFGLIY